MKTQRVLLGEHQYIWIVIDDDYLPNQPIFQFIRYLNNLSKSPNTIRAYANHLKLYWQYLKTLNADWNNINLEILSGFIGWLKQQKKQPFSRKNDDSNVLHFNNYHFRKPITINTILTAITAFYEFQCRLGNTQIELYKIIHSGFKSYKPFLHHISKKNPTKSRILKLKEPKLLPKTLTKEQIQALITACGSLRDQFLISLLYETGMRIGQALGLWLEDIKSWDNEIHIQARSNLENGARSKSQKSNIVHVSKDLMTLYAKYIIEEHQVVSKSQYVFIQTSGKNSGNPLTYTAIKSLFRRLSEKIHFKVTPHMLRHTHATELMRSGWQAKYVQKRLGHANIQTTLDIYSHADQSDLKKAFQDFQQTKGEKNETK